MILWLGRVRDEVSQHIASHIFLAEKIHPIGFDIVVHDDHLMVASSNATTVGVLLGPLRSVNSRPSLVSSVIVNTAT